MSLKDYLFTSESVSEGHPDKISDQISDAVLDAMLAGDPRSRVAVETMCMTGMVIVGGEVTSKSYVDIQELVRGVVKDIGYHDSEMGFDYRSCGIMNAINKQSPDIAMGVDKAEMGAGDQGMMFGFAVNETPELMPMPISFAHAMMRRLTEFRKGPNGKFLRPDSKGQVTVRYENNKPVEILTVVLSTQHAPDATQEKIREAMIEEVIKKAMPAEMLGKNVVYHVNPTGRFVVGGPHGDTGLTGRKIIVDTYGGACPHGGGAFSGKDPSKVDRSAAYAARYVAKNIVAAGIARQCQIQVAYAIGVAKPMNVTVYTEGTGVISDDKIAHLINEHFDLRPKGIINMLNLLRPIYQKTAAYGHFGRDEPEFTWEMTDKAATLRAAAGL